MEDAPGMKHLYHVQDLAEMYRVMRSAECFQRYDKISHEIAAEILAAAVLDGEVIGGNRRGSDVRTQRYGIVEVKSRILGTDGPFPRVSLKRHHFETANFIFAVRWKPDQEFYAAYLLPSSAARQLYEIRRQANGTAHIAWGDWINDANVINLTEDSRAFLGGGST